MQEEWYESTRRDKLRAEAFVSTPYGKALSEMWSDRSHAVLEERIQRGEKIAFSAEDLAKHEEWRKKHYKQKPPQREV